MWFYAVASFRVMVAGFQSPRAVGPNGHRACSLLHAWNMSKSRYLLALRNNHTCIHTYIQIYTHTYIYAFIRTYIYTYMHMCIHTYIHFVGSWCCRETNKFLQDTWNSVPPHGALNNAISTCGSRISTFRHSAPSAQLLSSAVVVFQQIGMLTMKSLNFNGCDAWLVACWDFMWFCAIPSFMGHVPNPPSLCTMGLSGYTSCPFHYVHASSP